MQGAAAGRCHHRGAAWEASAGASVLARGPGDTLLMLRLSKHDTGMLPKDAGVQSVIQ